METKVINLHGGPGIGKSTLMYQLTGEMKAQGYNVELVMEYAKELVFDNPAALKGEPHPIFEEQHKRIKRLVGNVEYIVCDSPLLLSIIYPELYGVGDYFYFEAVRDAIDELNNIDIFLLRSGGYNTHGRIQTETEAIDLDDRILNALTDRSLDFSVMDSRDNTVGNIIYLIDELKKEG